MASDRAKVAHVWRRLGFGPRPGDAGSGDIDYWSDPSRGPQALIDNLTARTPRPPADYGFPPSQDGTEDARLYARNIELFVDDANPLEERMTWTLMGLLVVASSDNVNWLLLKQYATALRSRALGTYDLLLREVVESPAMQFYLNGFESVVGHPNENLARELLELFALGVTDEAGAANYGESDVKEIARALTGYQPNGNRDGSDFVGSRWDAGPKTFLGAARGAARIGEVIDAVCGHAAYRPYVVARIYRELVGLAPPPGAVAGIVASLGSGPLDLRAAARAVALRPEFLSDAAIKSKIKSPLELVVSALRALRLGNFYDPDPQAGSFHLDDDMKKTQQLLFRAPNVNGWPYGAQWLHSSYLIGWNQLAHYFTRRDRRQPNLAPVNQCWTIRTLETDGYGRSGIERADRCLDLLGIVDAADATRDALASYALPGSGTWNIERAIGVTALALMSPDFLLS